MDYAVIEVNKQQHLVKPGDKISTLGILGDQDTVIKDVKVLLYKDGDNLEIGTPYLEKQTLDLVIKNINKTDKVDIFKFKSKSRYRRHTGHRQDQTILEVATPKAPKAPKETKETPKKTATPKKK